MKVWIVTISEVIDYQVNNYAPRVFSTYEKARRYFDESVKEMKEELPADWTTESGTDYFEMYESGYYDDNHSSISIDSAVVDENEI